MGVFTLQKQEVLVGSIWIGAMMVEVGFNPLPPASTMAQLILACGIPHKAALHAPLLGGPPESPYIDTTVKSGHKSRAGISREPS